MMCWGEPSVKVIGDEPKYVALARLGKSFFFTKQGSNLRRPSYYPICPSGSAHQVGCGRRVEGKG
jgi:hypothetical protein